MICKKCGRYTDQFDWPERDLAFFTGEICYPCFLESREEKPVIVQQDEETSENDDITIDEPENDPELDDAPDVDAYPEETTELGKSDEIFPDIAELDTTNLVQLTKPQQPIFTMEELQNAPIFSPTSAADENDSIENTKRMLFG